MQTPEQQRQFFETFGYLVMPGLVAGDISWITSEFEAVFTDRGIRHDGAARSCVVPFIDQRERLCTLLDNPQIVSVISNLVGADFNYLGGDGNYYTGDTNWHSDGFHIVGSYVKVALYLDPVAWDTGCLRVIPGSHQVETQAFWRRNAPGRAAELWGIAPGDVPCVPLASMPGDVVFFNHNLLHAAFGGSSRRRMFTLNVCRRCETSDEIKDLEDFIASTGRFWIDSMHGEIMKKTASPDRCVHLRQVTEHESHLPALAAQARQRMTEPSRG